MNLINHGKKKPPIPLMRQSHGAWDLGTIVVLFALLLVYCFASKFTPEHSINMLSTIGVPMAMAILGKRIIRWMGGGENK